MKTFHYATAIVLAIAMFVACGKDEITDLQTSVDSGATDETTIDDFTADRTVYVTYSTSGDATVTGTSDEFAVSISGNGVTIANNGDDKVTYVLSGSTGNGYFKLYSLRKQAIYLNSVSITNPNGAAINIQGSADSLSRGKRAYVVLNGNSTLSDGTTYAGTLLGEDEKGVFFSEGVLYFSGSGSLAVTAKGKSGIVTDDELYIQGGTINVSMTSSARVISGDTLKPACIRGKEAFGISGGTLTVSSSGTGGKGISGDGTASFSGGTVTVNVTGSNFGSSGGSGGGMGPGGQSNSSSGVPAKGIKFDGSVAFSGSDVSVSCSSHEGIESKGALTVTAGSVYSYSAADDAINASGDITITGGYVGAHSTSNDAIDANGDMHIQGGVVYAVTSASGAEVALDANTESGKKLYVEGGTLIVVGGMENGAQLTQSCYQASSVTGNVWYSIIVGSDTYAFKTPSTSTSGGGGHGPGGGGSNNALVVSGSSQPTVKSGVSVSGGTSYFGGTFNVGGTISGGSGVSLSGYSGGNGGGFPF